MARGRSGTREGPQIIRFSDARASISMRALPPTLPYAEARKLIRKADTVLCRLRVRWWNIHDWATCLIALVAWTRGQPVLSFWHRYVHAAKVVESEGRYMLAEVTAGGGRLMRLSDVAQQLPGKLVVFRPKPKRYDRDAAAQAMVDSTGRPYGWIACLLMAGMHFVFLGSIAKRLALRWSNWLLPDCSMEVAIADIAGGINPCPGKAPFEIEPHHLAESLYYEPICGLA